MKSSRRLRTLIPVIAVAFVGGAALATSSARASAPTLPLEINGKHVMWNPTDVGAPSPSTDPNQAGGNLLYHGGLVETKPAAYLVFWGPSWKSGFAIKGGTSSTGIYTYTNRSVMTYLTTMFQVIGGTPLAGIQTQYCDNVDPGLDCSSPVSQTTAQYVTNPTHQLKGVWVDSSPVPSTIATTALAENSTNDPIATEALKASQHFGYDINATYFILTQPGITATAFGQVYCAYHSETSHTTGHGVRYAFVPFAPDGGCFENSVNNKNNAFGNGYLDGYSVAAEHEYEEAVTDPDNFNSTQDGWNDSKTFETGDKCEGVAFKNLVVGSLKWAVQPLWSNEANGGQGGCVWSR